MAHSSTTNYNYPTSLASPKRLSSIVLLSPAQVLVPLYDKHGLLFIGIWLCLPLIAQL